MGENDNRIGGVDIGHGLMALASELQSSLYLIARLAELNDGAITDIRSEAEEALTLLDSYLFAAQTERGQLTLNIEPVALGSVLHVAKYDLRRSLGSQSQQIKTIDKVHAPVMTHRQALRNILVGTGQFLAGSLDSNDADIVLRSYQTSDRHIGVGVFVLDDTLSMKDLDKAVEHAGSMHMPLPKHSSQTGISLLIANSLCTALGGSLHAKRMGRYSGLATLLPKSEQLAFT